jgi:hypothetical protein
LSIQYQPKSDAAQGRDKRCQFGANEPESTSLSDESIAFHPQIALAIENDGHSKIDWS